MILRPCGSKKVAKEPKKHLTWKTVASNMAQENPEGKVGQTKFEHQTSGQHGLAMVGAMVHGGPYGRTVVLPVPPAT